MARRLKQQVITFVSNQLQSGGGMLQLISFLEVDHHVLVPFVCSSVHSANHLGLTLYLHAYHLYFNFHPYHLSFWRFPPTFAETLGT